MASSWMKAPVRTFALVWAGRAYLMAGAGLVVCTGVVPQYMQWSELSIRVSSCALQLGGLGIVVKGVADTRKQFGQRSLTDRSMNWIRKGLYPAIKRILRFLRILKKPPPIFGEGHSTQASATASGTGYVGLTPTPTVEGRIAELEKFVTRLQATVMENHSATIGKMQEFRVDLDKGRSNQDSANEAIGKKLEATATGGLDLSMFGVCLLAVGAIYGAFPQEISDFMARSIAPHCWGPLASMAEGLRDALGKA
jgi:hypothetical protein